MQIKPLTIPQQALLFVLILIAIPLFLSTMLFLWVMGMGNQVKTTNERGKP